MSDNPFETLGLNKELVVFLNQKGQLDDFLRDYCLRVQLRVHPDHGGDNELSARINNACSEIKKAKGNYASLIDGIGSGSDEYLPLIEALTERVERLSKVEAEYEELRRKYAELLAGGFKTEKVRTASGRRARTVEDEPHVRTPPRARRTAPEPVISAKPITLHDIILYDAKGKPLHTYKKVTVSGKSIGTAKDYLSKTQNNWTAYFEDKKEKLISLPLLYAVLERLVDEKHPALARLAKDFRDSWLCTSTRINYGSNTIIHNYGTSTAETFHCTIPEESYYLKDLLKKKGHDSRRNALRALLMAQDVDKVDGILTQVAGVSPYFWTSDIVNRRANPEMAAFVYAYAVRLGLNCDLGLYYSGRARSVVVEV